ncbi:MAG: TatD family hydrolase [Weeksellaceae bacterium]|nr:TatD family hydrolase [Weeksellaceae bacterium]
MKLIDSHIHFYSEEYAEDRTTLMEEAVQEGIQQFYLPSIDSSYYNSMRECEEKFGTESMQLMMGLHPVYVKPDTYEAELEFVAEQLQKRQFAAVGEIGIDLYWDVTTLEIQKHAFKEQITLAKQCDLPIVIHSRNSYNEVMEVLQDAGRGTISGIFHCFTGSEEEALRVIDMGMKIGIGGVLTFKNGGINQWIKNIDLEHIVLETDGPYLAPAPYRGKRNVPAYLKIVAQTLADIHERPLVEVAAITSENCLKVFKTYD